MIVTVRRSGGFAGIEETLGTLDTEDMPESTGVKLEQLIARLEQISDEAELQYATDMFQYQVEVVDDNQQQVLSIYDDTDESNELTTTLYMLLDLFTSK